MPSPAFTAVLEPFALGEPMKKGVGFMKFVRSLLVGTVVVSGAASLSACDPIDEKPCSSGSYPVKAQDGPGSTCVKSGDAVPHGYITYAPGSTPTTP